MRIHQDFKRIRIMLAAALVLSALLLVGICVLPQLFIRSLSKEVRPLIAAAREATLSGNSESALPELKKLRGAIEERNELLMLFFNHSRLFEVEEAAISAERLAQVNDVEQLIAELTDIEYGIEYLLHLNEARFHNLL